LELDEGSNPMTVRFTRRRAITVLAAAAGLPLLMKAGRAEARVMRWQGTSLGADASIQLYHNDEAKARAAVDAGVAELARLESMFSLYRADSTISALNRDGKVENAPAEFVELVSVSRDAAAKTDGWFDPTVHPMFQLYFRHFIADNPDPAGPSAAAIKETLKLVDWRAIQVDSDRRSVALARPGMGLTLNSTGQGYISDRVADVLRGYGFENMLVDMGELRAVSSKPDGSAWRVGIADPAEPSRSITEIDVVDRAIATSGGYGTIFDDAGRFTHLIDPFTGGTAPRLAGVTVIADTATKANALSTPLTLVPRADRQRMLSAFGGVKAIFVTPAGIEETLEA
jgi:thiamine biosynthesis lipoprotein